MGRAILSAIAVVLLAIRPAQVVAQDRLEYQVKAAFLFNFLKFVEWPPAAGDTPWVIGVLGHDPFGEVLDQTVKGKIVNGRPVQVRRFSRVGDVKDCNILFIGGADFGRIGIPALPGMLTVGEAPGFLKSGGIINFYIEDNRVHFEIRPTVARSAGLRVSSQLLKLGKTL
ncbi:MAG: YfiR family protein [Bryobacteraceae bacterium]|jgi:uncharacterized protein DUF4154